MSPTLDEMLNDLPSKEDLEKLPRYCKWCGTWNPEITENKAINTPYFFCKFCGDNGKRTEFARTEEALKSKQRLDAKRHGKYLPPEELVKGPQDKCPNCGATVEEGKVCRWPEHFRPRIAIVDIIHCGCCVCRGQWFYYLEDAPQPY